MAENGPDLPLKDYHQIRARLLARDEIAFLDVREEAPHAEGHPLFAANVPLSRLELLAYAKLPRRDVSIVTLDSGEGLAELAAQRLKSMGYTDVAVFEGGIEGWKAAGGELFIDVNVPSKAFGELLESVCHTPSLPAEEVKALIDSGEDCIVVDARRFDEYQTMTIPGSISVPGAELALRVPQMAPNPATKVIVHCAGRTRSLIGTQSLINFGIPNHVWALRNGTIGWTLARQKLDLAQSRKYPENSDSPAVAASAEKARDVAERAGVKRATPDDVRRWSDQNGRSTYFFDVRSPEEYARAHVPGFLSIPGGQLVQELEMYAPVRGARIVLCDSEGVRANMTASWLAQMAWDVVVADGFDAADFTETGVPKIQLPAVPINRSVNVATLATWLATEGDTVVVDVARHAVFRKGHIPGAWFLIRSLLPDSAPNLPEASRYVMTCPDGLLSQFVAPELATKVKAGVYVLEGGTAAWTAAGNQIETGETRLASPPIDRYRRPYEGTEVPDSAMQAYLDWEFGLVAQLERDGTHHFKPMTSSH
ncbi:MAG: rhodanese-related sulfurtransferase [Sphingomonadales bacterium]|nr:rhodanese-related sulfurtransferase [Sphingomonadales bacterium]